MTYSAPTVAGVVLAAGQGSRFGRPKAPVRVEGERLVDRSVRLLHSSGCAPVFVVLGAWRGSVDNARIVINDDWNEGMGSSLRRAIEEVQSSTNADYVLITLVDLPDLTVEVMTRVVTAPPGIAVASFNGTRGHPVRIPREHFPELIGKLGGDEGARSFLRDRNDVHFVEVGDLASGQDIDVPEDLSADQAN